MRAVCSILLVILAGCSHRTVPGGVQATEPRDRSTVALVVLTAPFKPDPAWLVERWEQTWGIGGALRVMHEWTDPTKTRRRYRISDGRHALVLELSSDRLTGPQLEPLLASAGKLGAREQAELRRHHGYLDLAFAQTTRPSMGAARLAARTLLLLLARPETTGYATGPAMRYRTVPKAGPDPTLSGRLLRTLFVDMVEHPIPGGRVVHTLGLDVFGYPDLRMRPGGGRNETTCRELLARAVESLLEEDNPPTGNTRLALPGPLVLEMRAVDLPRHPAGRYGVLELSVP